MGTELSFYMSAMLSSTNSGSGRQDDIVLHSMSHFSLLLPTRSELGDSVPPDLFARQQIRNIARNSLWHMIPDKCTSSLYEIRSHTCSP